MMLLENGFVSNYEFILIVAENYHNLTFEVQLRQELKHN